MLQYLRGFFLLPLPQITLRLGEKKTLEDKDVLGWALSYRESRISTLRKSQGIYKASLPLWGGSMATTSCWGALPMRQSPSSPSPREYSPYTEASHPSCPGKYRWRRRHSGVISPKATDHCDPAARKFVWSIFFLLALPQKSPERGTF